METETVSYVDPAVIQAFPQTKSYLANEARAEAKGQFACPCCGKAVRETADALFIEVVYIQGVNASAYRAAPGAEGAKVGPFADSQGCFAVGSACAKRLRKAGAWVSKLEPIEGRTEGAK